MQRLLALLPSPGAPSFGRAAGLRALAAGLLLVLLATCHRAAAPSPPAEPDLSVEEVAQRLPAKVADREGWALDVVAALEANGHRPTLSNVCQVLAVVEQESGYEANPVVPNLARLVKGQLEAYAQKLGPLGPPAMRELLGRKGQGQRHTFAERLERVRTERDLDRVFRDLLAYYRDEFPATFATASVLGQLFAHTRFEDLNPITTAGSMQVSVQFSEDLARSRGRAPEEVRDSLYTRAGGLYYGVARLLGYEASYDTPLYRFADYNAGFYASRNAALQTQLSELTGRPLVPDGDLLAYDKRGEPVREDSRTLKALLAFRERLAPEVSEWRLRRDVRQEKTGDFERTDTWRALKRVYRERKGKEPAYARVPEVTIKSPKMAKDRSTAWFARNVDYRYQQCLKRR